MPVTTKSPDYEKYSPRWERVRDVLDGEDTVKEKKEQYIPKTSGMRKGGSGSKDYDAYRDRARIYGITQRSHTGIIGLMFEKDPEGISDKIVTNNGMTLLQLAREVARAVTATGRDILLVDAPADGGKPYIARYPAKCLINWKTDPSNPSRLTLAVFKEGKSKSDADEYSHDTDDVYRRYMMKDGKVTIEIFNEKGESVEAERIINAPQLDAENPTLPIFMPGSIDNSPACDPVPLLTTANCELSAYRLSADYHLCLFLTNHGTPTVSGVNNDQYSAIVEQGIGPSALWHLGSTGVAGFLESTGVGISASKSAIQDELDEAEKNAIRLTSGGSAESTETVRIRSSQMHASVYTMADSISIGITNANKLRAKWASEQPMDDFVISTEFSSKHAHQAMIGAIDSAVNSGNVPRSVMFEVLRKSGLTEATNEELEAMLKEDGPPISANFGEA